MKAHEKLLVIELAKIFRDHRSEIVQKFLELIQAEDLIQEEVELEIFRNGIDKLLADFTYYLSRDDFEGYFESNAAVAKDIALNDIPYKTFIRAFHIFEESYSDAIKDHIDPNKALLYVIAIDRLHHETIAIVSEAYFEINDTTVLSLVSLSELRDHDTGQHLERTRGYSALLARELDMGRNFIDNIFKASPLHDIGKVGIQDSILLKPAGLDEFEYKIMKTHALLGSQTIDQIINKRRIKRGGLFMAKEIALGHHEKYDGSGYPRGLHNEEIPIAARIFALSDAYDAITSKRPYKEPYPHDVAMERILKDKGTHFDPKVVDAFLKNEKLFLELCEKSKKN